ncbi:hypothetical protein TOPH_03496 [Tolypocladium ophioglossoides CBS 100239]|uniref:Alpha-D-glucose-1-phosphate phosphatase YihX n=1 Tax=Tolypocladium ophioglossoides (strain CBS 100239) TaxID=1163406 RepID=A0A0L0NDA1_TOLOC|nr:hypothetical protein TOPH_03496 [Tolypocladium ophioglossoides CBS 100239]
MASRRYTDLLLDIGGVLISYSTKNNTALPPRTIKTVLDSPHWHEYEKGKLSRQQCYDKVTAQFGLAPGTWAEAVKQLQSTLKPNQDFIAAIKDMKASYPRLRVHAFSNISAPDFDYLKPTIDKWGIFDNVVTSASIGCRKPDFGSYRQALDSAQISAHTSIFVDDRSENVITAHSLGIRGVLFENTVIVIAQLHNLLGDPVARGMAFLRRRAKALFCETDNGITIKENFSQLLILQRIGDSHQKQAAMEAILENLTPDGLPLIYFDKLRPRFCPFVSANVLRLFYLNGQGYKLRSTLRYICSILHTQAYEIGKRYYCHSDWIFYYLADLCRKCSNPDLNELRMILSTQLKRRMGTDKDVLAAALRVLAAQSLGFENPRDLETLLVAQQLDGGWEFAWMFTYGSVAVKVGSRGVTTALTIKAIQTARGVEGLSAESNKF